MKLEHKKTVATTTTWTITKKEFFELLNIQSTDRVDFCFSKPRVDSRGTEIIDRQHANQNFDTVQITTHKTEEIDLLPKSKDSVDFDFT